jgi:hypothetical protein
VSIFKSSRGWDELKKINLRKILEEVEAENKGKPFSNMDKNVVFIISALNALREGLLEIEKRMEAEPELKKSNNRSSGHPISSVKSVPIEEVDKYLQEGYHVKRIYSKHAILIKSK